MIQRKLQTCLLTVFIFCMATSAARAEVTGFEVKSRTDVAGYNYEKVVGRIHFAVDPRNPHNAVIADLDKAQQDAAGKVVFSADLYVWKPKSGGSEVALVDIVNRGRLTFQGFSAVSGQDPVGDGFLVKRGLTVVAVGWEFDVAASDNLLRLDAPIATEGGKPITGMVSAMFVPDRPDPMVVNALAGYRAIDPASTESVLTVRDGLLKTATRLPRDQWTISSNNTVTLKGGFQPGHMYEITYRAANPPIAGLGFAAVRDVAAWLRHGADSMAPVKFAYTFGASQSGRFLREFLYEGFNTDENGARVFDGVMAHIAGSGRFELNSRWATPVECCSTLATSFPFSAAGQRDPVTGLTEGLLDNARARGNQPKLFLTNTGVEY